ncbi:MAG: glycosyltransferase family 4 protein [Arcanobacterium sp.]|nr:glycosyltransferase family 4 protein [Arcanobacterium sp.]MDY5589217.1 glycosyltransferase family 4 protein [Arcanobacterium sp.]
MAGKRAQKNPAGAPHIAIASRIFVPEPAAASFRLRALVQALVEKGAAVEVLTAQLPASLKNIPVNLPQAVQIKRAPVLRDSTGYIKGYMQYMSFDIPLFFRLLFGRKYDAVVCEPPPTTGFFTRIACTLRRTPYVYYAADIWSDAAAASAPKAVVAALRWVEKRALRGAREVLAISDGVARRVRELGAQRVAVVPNGIDTDAFSWEGERKAGVFFVYAGTSSEWQGAEVFAEAMKTVVQQWPHARLIYVGSGSADGAIAEIARELPQGTIEQLGRVSADEAAAWQRSAVAALVSIKPGLGYDFAMPTKVYSALACGTPVIYAGVGPLTQVITDEHFGEAVAYDTDAVTQAMLRMLENATACGAGCGDAPDAEKPHARGDSEAVGVTHSHTGVTLAQAERTEKLRRRQWVLDYRSLALTGKKAAETVLDMARR